MKNPELAKILLQEAKALRSEIASVKGGVSLSGLKSLWEHAPAVIKRVEAIAPDAAGEDKLELAVELLCEVVNIWWLPDWAIRLYAPSIIESALAALKTKFQG
jgi:hypothetical protein